jgi:hypothetical protein
MEQKERNVLVYKDNGDGKLKFKTSATQFSDILEVIKKEFNMTDAEVSKYEFIDGIHRTRYATNSILPEKSIHPRTGAETTDLSIFMVRTKKNTESGSRKKSQLVEVDRADVVHRMNAMGYNNDILRSFGRNYTQVSTDELFVYLYIKGDLSFNYKIKDETLLRRMVNEAKSTWPCFNKEIPAKKSIYKKSSDEKPEQNENDARYQSGSCNSQSESEEKTEDAYKEDEHDAGIGNNEPKEKASSDVLKEFSDKELEDELILRFTGRADDANNFINRFIDKALPASITDSDMQDMMNRI